MELHKNPILFYEEQKFRAIWLWMLLIIIVSTMWYACIRQIFYGVPLDENPMPTPFLCIFWIFFGIIMPISFWFVALETTLTSDRLVARFSYMFLIRRTIPTEDIFRCQVIRYTFSESGGYGVRYMISRGWMFNVSGNEAVEVQLKNGTCFYIGSQRAEDLKNAILSLLGRRGASKS